MKYVGEKKTDDKHLTLFNGYMALNPEAPNAAGYFRPPADPDTFAVVYA
jgi:hypothetical protein